MTATESEHPTPDQPWDRGWIGRVLDSCVRHLVLTAAAAVLGTCGAFLAISVLVVSEWPLGLLMLSLLLFAAFAGGALAICCMLAGISQLLSDTEDKRSARAILLGGTVWLMLAVTLYPLTAKTSLDIHVQGVAKRAIPAAAPLLAAIRAYERAHGSPPPELESLMPRYIASLPWTGLGNYPDFRYRASTPSSPIPGGAAWSLSVPCSRGGINFDMLIYHSNESYPEKEYGGVLQPVGNWAYVHE